MGSSGLDAEWQLAANIGGCVADDYALDNRHRQARSLSPGGISAMTMR